MDCPDTKPIPVMYIENQFSLPRRQWFANHQQIYFSHLIGKNEVPCVEFDAQVFMKFLSDLNSISGYNVLRIYIARFGDVSDPNVPAGYDKNLTVIFVPVKKSGNPEVYSELDYYHFPTPGTYRSIGSATKQQWINNYARTRMSVPGSAELDTVFIAHDAKKIDQFNSEIQCEGAKGVRAYFSAYRDNEPAAFDYQQRLFVAFALTDGIGPSAKDIDIEQTPNYQTRKNNTKSMLDFDNGTLCPPCQNCINQGITAPGC